MVCSKYGGPGGNNLIFHCGGKLEFSFRLSYSPKALVILNS